jgi:predicted hydrocarbon binding protein
MQSTHDLERGEIVELGVRYLMMRPDVLMGVAHELAPRESTLFLQALEQSAFRNAQASFRQYSLQNSIAAESLLAKYLEMAAHLGWGSWTIIPVRQASREVEVRNSPFAAGFGQSAIPVCSPIKGVLKAMMIVAYSASVEVREVTCAAQGGRICRFTLENVGSVT